MVHVSIKRAVTYIALGATTSLGMLKSTQAWASDDSPTGAPHALSAPPPHALHAPEHLILQRTPMLAPLMLHNPADDTAAVAVTADADVEPSARAGDAVFDPALAFALTAPGDLAIRKVPTFAPLALSLNDAAAESAPEVATTEALAPAAAIPTRTQERPATALPAEFLSQNAMPAATPLAQALGAPTDPAVAAAATATPEAAQSDAALPISEALLPQVNFWKRVYSEVDSSHGFVHDAWHLDVIYRTIAVPAGTRRQSVRGIAQEVTRVSTILRNLAHGHRNSPSAEEASVLAAWPKDVSNATLLDAARNVRFQTGQSDKFRAGLMRARTWTPFIASTFAAAGLPRELAALPHVESSFNMMAYSKVRAAGIWQFMPSTARLFMHMDSTVDERLDPIRSTESAAHLLAQNYRLLGSWPLAITAYNHGPQGVHRAVKATKSTDLAVIISKYKTKHFGFASRNFYTELLAAWDVSQHPEKYFGAMPSEAPLQYETVTTDAFYHAKSVASALGIDLAVLRQHNPALRPVVWSNSRLIPRGFTLRVPRDQVHGDMLAMLGNIPQAARFAHADAAPVKMKVASSRHAVAVARRQSARRIVAQRSKTARSTRVASKSPAPHGTGDTLKAPLPWEKPAEPTPTLHSDTSQLPRSWFE